MSGEITFKDENKNIRKLKKDILIFRESRDGNQKVYCLEGDCRRNEEGNIQMAEIGFSTKVRLTLQKGVV